MFGLRQKLTFGFGGLLLILLGVSGLGIAVLKQHRNALDKFLYENWRSVEYGQHMVDALDRLDDAAKVGADSSATAVDLTTARAATARAVDEFDTNIQDENHNITLPGEDALAAALTDVWKGDGGYKTTHAAVMDVKTAAARRAAAYASLQKLSRKVKASAQAIMRLNLDNMKPIDGRAKALSDAVSRLMFILAAVGAALAVVFIAVMSRSILRPIETLTRSARQIEQGNLDLVVQVKSRDELKELAEAFNSMAAKLREYRRTNRAKMVRTQQTTQLAINSLPDAVAILSPQGIIEMANSAAQQLFGIRPDMRVSEMPTPWLAELYRRTSTSLLPIEPRGYESALQVLDEGGGEKFFLPHAVPILDEERQLLGVTVVLADVTNLRRLDEMKSGMLAVVSHELKTPLTSIRMGAHLLLEERVGPLTPQQSDLLMAVRDDSDRLNQIVMNLLDMGRIESGRALMDLKPEPIEGVVHESTEPLRAAFADRGVELVIDLPADLPPILVDRTRIGLVFSNLLTNALKYTAPGGRVRVSAETAGDDQVRFIIEDTGSGIPAPFLPRIFERFFRVPGQGGGTGAGLGLAISKEVVEAHGGQIGVQSTEGIGTQFKFTLKRPGESENRIQHVHQNEAHDESSESALAVGAHSDRG